MTAQPIQVIILGADKGGLALIELFSRCNGVEITGVMDKDADAPGLRLARLLNIPIAHDAAALLAQNRAHLIIDVTGDPATASVITEHKEPHTETLSGTAARLLWSIVQQEQELHDQLVHVEKLATMGICAAGIAHELNNPLHCILGFAQLVQETQDPAAAKDYAQGIIDLIKHLSSITKSLTFYARASTKAESADVHLHQVLDEALKMAKFATILDEVVVVRTYQPIPAIRADTGDLLRIFFNLIANAAQAMNGRGQLTLATCFHNNLITVSIGDTGHGIPASDLPNVLASFSMTKAQGKGAGLGLYIVQILLKKYGGYLEIDSKQGVGTTVHIQLPSDASDPLPRASVGPCTRPYS